jgi:hypothetical protein
MDPTDAPPYEQQDRDLSQAAAIERIVSSLSAIACRQQSVNDAESTY